MEKRPSYFNKRKIISNYIAYANSENRVYVPENKEGFEKLIEALFKKIKAPTEEQKLNFNIIKKYPFLLPKNRWDKGLSVGKFGFDFFWTELDGMPRGWFIAFGKQLLDDLLVCLLKEKQDFLYQYMIVQIKEKFGRLRWYDNGNTDCGYKIISKYEKISAKTCIMCGKPGKIDEAEYWLEPLCKEHRANRNINEVHESLHIASIEALKNLIKY